MLRRRILTAVVVVPPLIAALFWLSPLGVVVLFGLIVAAGAWEWSGLCGWGYLGRGAYLAVLLLGGGVLVAAALMRGDIAYVILGAAAVWWAVALIDLVWSAAGIFRSHAGRALAGLLTLIPAWVALSLLHAVDPRRPTMVLFVLALVAAADTAAYAAGHAFGRTKLAPAVSPGKTVEGVVGGVAAVVLVAVFCGRMIFDFSGSRLGAWVVLAAVAGVVSVLGDLVESKLKRLAGAKDSGRLLPGHGGVLDRIDALTAAAPIFALGWLAAFDARV